MKVTILQTDIEWGSPLANIAHAEQLMATQPDSDLYVLPEMWATGFATEPYGIAEMENESVSLSWMRNTAKARNCAICGSLAIQQTQAAQDVFLNRQYFIDGKTGMEYYYDKHHLFSYGGEDRHYSPGNQHCVADYGGFRFLLITCYDLRFPVWSRYSDKLRFDAIICVANWPSSRQNAWQILTRARAIENQAYFIACNRVGDDAKCHYRGQSAILSPIGKSLSACRSNVPDAATYAIDLKRLTDSRNKFHVLEDRDIF